MEILQIIRDKFYFGMKIKQDYYFAFWRKKNNNKTSPYWSPTKKEHRKCLFLLERLYIAKADANCIKVETQIFLDHPTGKNEHYFP